MSQNEDVKLEETAAEEVKEQTAEETDTVREPLDSIEQTVAELKKKIQELSENDDNEPETKAGVSEEAKEKIVKITEKTVETVNESIVQLRTKAAEAVENNEDLKKTVAYIKDNAVKAVEAAKVMIGDLKKESALQEAGRKASEVWNKATAAAAGMMKQASDYVQKQIGEEKSAELKAKLDEAQKAINDNTKKAVQKADEFYNKPEVQEAIVKMRTTAADLAQKGSEAVQNILKKEPAEPEKKEDAPDQEKAAEEPAAPAEEPAAPVQDDQKEE